MYTWKAAFKVLPLFYCRDCRCYNYWCMCPVCVSPREPNGLLKRFAGPRKTLPHYLNNKSAAKTARWLFDQILDAGYRANPADRIAVKELLEEADTFLRRMKQPPIPALPRMLLKAKQHFQLLLQAGPLALPPPPPLWHPAAAAAVAAPSKRRRRGGP